MEEDLCAEHHGQADEFGVSPFVADDRGAGDFVEVEERELDVEEIEKRIRKERLFSSSNRWLSSSDIKNGYVVASHHLELLADAIALDIIVV